MSTVPVHTNLSIATYAKLHRAAEAHNTTVGALTAELVRRALAESSGPQPAPAAPAAPAAAPAPKPLTKAALERIAIAERRAERLERKAQTEAARTAKAEARAALVERIRELHGKKISDAGIARELGVSQPFVNTIRRIELGLPTHYAFGGNLEAPKR